MYLGEFGADISHIFQIFLKVLKHRLILNVNMYD